MLYNNGDGCCLYWLFRYLFQAEIFDFLRKLLQPCRSRINASFCTSVSKLVYCDQTPNAYMTQLINLVTKEAFNHELINIFHKVFLKIQRFEKRPLKFEQHSAALWELDSFLGCSV